MKLIKKLFEQYTEVFIGIIFVFLIGIFFPVLWLLIPLMIIGIPFYPLMKWANKQDKKRRWMAKRRNEKEWEEELKNKE